MNKFSKIIQIIGSSICYKLLQTLRRHDDAKISKLAVFADDDLGLRITCLGEFETETLSYLREKIKGNMKSSHFIDVGANVGNHTNGLSEYFAHCHAFEPSPKTFQLLKVNMTNKANVTCYQVALSDTNGQTMLAHDNLNSGKSHITYPNLTEKKVAKPHLIPVETRRLDHVISKNCPIGAIKIDVEGHEIQVLRGAAGIIKAQKPLIIIEVLSREIIDGHSECLDYLNEIGYNRFESVEPLFMHFSFINHVRFLRWINHLLLILDLIVSGPHRARIKTLKISSLKKKDYNTILASP